LIKWTRLKGALPEPTNIKLLVNASVSLTKANRANSNPLRTYR